MSDRIEKARGLERVEVQYGDQSQPIIYEGVLNTYFKGGAFCVLMADGKTVYKHNGNLWWRVKEVSP